ncbi:endochitinase [Penaeus vannamei]|uniref:Endochitinase n=1 Tax=Penaeus vannamei TaxID=6689 RepID=A0A3R7MDG4_PENVA|nr:endochitinase [Penaeus vannamei]
MKTRRSEGEINRPPPPGGAQDLDGNNKRSGVNLGLDVNSLPRASTCRVRLLVTPALKPWRVLGGVGAGAPGKLFGRPPVPTARRRREVTDSPTLRTARYLIARTDTRYPTSDGKVRGIKQPDTQARYPTSRRRCEVSESPTQEPPVPDSQTRENFPDEATPEQQTSAYTSNSCRSRHPLVLPPPTKPRTAYPRGAKFSPMAFKSLADGRRRLPTGHEITNLHFLQSRAYISLQSRAYFPSSHELTFPSSHELTFPSSHELTFPSSHELTFPSSHELTFPSSHELPSITNYISLQSRTYISLQSRTYIPSSHELTFPSSHELTFPSSHELTFPSSHELTFPSSHELTFPCSSSLLLPPNILFFFFPSISLSVALKCSFFSPSSIFFPSHSIFPSPFHLYFLPSFCSTSLHFSPFLLPFSFNFSPLLSCISLPFCHHFLSIFRPFLKHPSLSTPPSSPFLSPPPSFPFPSLPSSNAPPTPTPTPSLPPFTPLFFVPLHCLSSLKNSMGQYVLTLYFFPLVFTTACTLAKFPSS